MKFNGRSMRARMTVGFVIGVAILLLITGAGLLWLANADAQARELNILNATALEFRGEIATGEISAWRPQQIMAADVAGFRAAGLALAIYDEKGRFLLGSNRNINGAFSRNEWRTVTVRDGARRLVIASSLVQSQLEFRRLSASLAFLGLTVLSASAIGAWALVGRVLSPIDRLAETALHAPVETTQLWAPSDDAEVKKLVGTLNDFLSRLRESGRQKERFYAAASHELRTPLQGLAGFLEIGLSRERPRAELVEILREAQGQSQRLVKLTADLLALSNIENTAQRSLEKAEIDVADVIERALRPLEPLRVAKKLDVRMDFPVSVEEAEITASWSHLEMLVRNLLENAHKYTPDEGAIRIVCRKNEFCVRNQVEWSYGEMRALHRVQERQSNSSQDSDLEQLFEPFFRLDATREGKIGGNGLGLSICRAICDSSDWHIDLQRCEISGRPALEARVSFNDSP